MDNAATFLVIIIVHNVERLPDLLHAWQAIGVPGATVLRSTGAYRMTTWLSRLGLGALERVVDSEDAGHQRTLMAAIESGELLSMAISEAERILGSFDEPHSGLLLVVPVAQVRGLHKVRSKPASDTLPAAVKPEWMVRRDMPVGQVLSDLRLEPAIVRPDASLDEVAQAMLQKPGTQLACVVEPGGRLVGLLDLQSLADDLFFHIMPEEFLSEISDMEEMMEFARKSNIRSAGDAMREPVWITHAETVKEAFKRMHENRLPGLPVVDERHHVVDYISLLGLLACCLGRLAQSSEQENREQNA